MADDHCCCKAQIEWLFWEQPDGKAVNKSPGYFMLSQYPACGISKKIDNRYGISNDKVKEQFLEDH